MNTRQNGRQKSTRPAAMPTKASDRTVDMFTGLTAVESKESEELDIQETEKGPDESIEQSAERWRNTALFTAEHLSKYFNDSIPGTSKFRLTEQNNNLYLEKFEVGKDGEAYSYAGLMFSTADLPELTSCIVAAYKDWKIRNNVG